MAIVIIREEMIAICWERTEILFRRKKRLLGNAVVLFLALYRVFKSMEPLSFDKPAETDVVRRLPTSAKVFMSASNETPS